MFFLVGLMGSGKSYFANKLSIELGFNCIDIDTLIEEQLQCTIADIFKHKGEAFFREHENNLLQQIITNTNQPTIVATGGGTPCFFDGINIMNKAGVTIWLNASIKQIVNHLITNKTNRPLIHSLNENELYTYFKKSLESRRSQYEKSQYILNESEITIKNLKEIIADYV